MQDQKKNDKLIKKPQKFVPQEVEVAPLDDITAQIESLVTMSESDRMMNMMRYQPIIDMGRCSVNCPCEPCRRGICSECNIGSYMGSRYGFPYGRG